MKKGFVILLAFFIAILAYNTRGILQEDFKGTPITKNESLKHKSLKAMDLPKRNQNTMDLQEIIFASEKAINLSKGDNVYLKLTQKDKEDKKSYPIMIYCVKIVEPLNENNMIHLIKELEKDDNTLTLKTLEIKSSLIITFEIESDGAYIFLVRDKQKELDASELEINYEFMITGESQPSAFSL